MLFALNQSVQIMPQQEELAYRVVIHANYTGKIQQAISGMQMLARDLMCSDLNALRELGSITTSGEALLNEKIQIGKTLLNREYEEGKKPIVPKRRSANGSPVFYIGQIIRHSITGDNGIIYSWDLNGNPECLRGSEELFHTHHQPL